MFTPAKVNLHLHVKELRQDGFHEISSIFQLISLYDEIVIRSLTNGEGLYLFGDVKGPVEKNTIFRAADVFRQFTGVKTGFSFTINKSIPTGAGLGGGSSNAAGILVALDRLCGTSLSEGDLLSLGGAVGSDVPFFISAAAAFVTGRGEEVVPLFPRSDFNILLVFPGFSINTRQAYNWLDEEKGEKPEYLDGETLRRMYKTSPAQDWRFFNSFTPMLMKRFPEFSKLFSLLASTGSLYSNVSGSGSCVFGIYPSYRKAQKALNLIKKGYAEIWITKPLENRIVDVLEYL